MPNLAKDEDMSSFLVIGVIMIIINCIDGSFPLLQILFIVSCIYLTNNRFPISKLLFIILCVYVLFYLAKTIFFLVSVKCGLHRPALMLERFSVNKDTVANYKALQKRLKVLNENITKSTDKLDSIKYIADNMKPDLCYILKQIDESNEGSYASNIPPEESKLPVEEQKKRAAERAKKAKVYVGETKTIYSKAHNNVPIMECFEDSSVSNVDTDALLAHLTDDINETESNLDILQSGINEIKALLSDKNIPMYDITLGYNDRYIKKLLDEATKSKKEGFADLGIDKTTLVSNPNVHVQALEDTYKSIYTEIDTYSKAIKIYNKRIIGQKESIKTLKAPLNDPKTQSATINASYEANRGK